jgi:hypothetical protein
LLEIFGEDLVVSFIEDSKVCGFGFCLCNGEIECGEVVLLGIVVL